jgi:hypothetical protein
LKTRKIRNKYGKIAMRIVYCENSVNHGITPIRSLKNSKLSAESVLIKFFYPRDFENFTRKDNSLNASNGPTFSTCDRKKIGKAEKLSSPCKDLDSHVKFPEVGDSQILSQWAYIGRKFIIPMQRPSLSSRKYSQ